MMTPRRGAARASELAAQWQQGDVRAAGTCKQQWDVRAAGGRACSRNGSRSGRPGRPAKTAGRDSEALAAKKRSAAVQLTRRAGRHHDSDGSHRDGHGLSLRPSLVGSPRLSSCCPASRHFKLAASVTVAAGVQVAGRLSAVGPGRLRGIGLGGAQVRWHR
jgi:hypothetical protein